MWCCDLLAAGSDDVTLLAGVAGLGGAVGGAERPVAARAHSLACRETGFMLEIREVVAPVTGSPQPRQTGPGGARAGPDSRGRSRHNSWPGSTCLVTTTTRPTPGLSSTRHTRSCSSVCPDHRYASSPSIPLSCYTLYRTAALPRCTDRTLSAFCRSL